MAFTAALSREDVIGLPLGIGSLPFTDPVEACEAVLNTMSRSPFWPELPRRDFRERIGFIQSEGIPGLVVDESQERVFAIDGEDISSELERFYSSYVSGAGLAMSSGYASGLETMLRLIGERGFEPEVIKGQLSGPTTLGLVLKFADGRPLLYDELMSDVLVKSIVMKARWMLSRFAEAGLPGLLFFDEPMLQSIGSPSVPVERQKAVDMMAEITSELPCLTGAHCCGNTDWAILMECGVDIIAFDSFHFVETMSLYPEQLNEFLSSGGLLAWGAIPASEEATSLEPADVVGQIVSGIELMGSKGVDTGLLADSCLVTPSCGLSSLRPEVAHGILGLTAAVAEMFETVAGEG